MLLLTPEENYIIEIFAGYITDTKDESWKLLFNNEIDFSNWITNIRIKSVFISSVDVSDADHIGTLSTCTYEFNNARFVIYGKLVSQICKD